MDYATPEDAGKALELLQDYAIDKNHKLSVTPYKRAIELAVLEDGEFKEPEPVKFVEKPSTQSWVMDPSQRDQFVIREGKETVGEFIQRCLFVYLLGLIIGLGST